MWKLSQRDAFWIPAPRADFFVTYFWDYFGKDALTVYAFVFFLFLFAGSFLVSPKEDEPASFLNDRRALSFVVLVSWIWVIYIVAYVKSLVSVPLLLNRYTIIVVPAILLAAAIGVDSLRKPLIRFYLTALIVLFSIVHLFLYSHYYQTPTKTQWREMSDFIVKNNAREFPILTDREWYLPYYFGVTHYKPSYVQQDSLEKLNDLWIVTAHLGQPLTGFNKEIVNREFRVRKKFSGVDAFATLYSRQKLHIPIRGVVRRPDGYYALFNNGILTSEPLQLNPGRYKVAVYGYGTIAKGEFPKVALSMNGKTLTIFDLQQEKDYTCILDKTDNGDAVFSLEFRNDANGDGEDRNVFVKFFDVQRLRGR